MKAVPGVGIEPSTLDFPSSPISDALFEVLVPDSHVRVSQNAFWTAKSESLRGFESSHTGLHQYGAIRIPSNVESELSWRRANSYARVGGGSKEERSFPSSLPR
jgi:hypothetical protein